MTATILATARYDLFPVLVHVSDFAADSAFDARLVEFARAHPRHNQSTSGLNLLNEPHAWAENLRSIFRAGLGTYLEEADPANELGRDVLMHAFFNYTPDSSFTPVHNHLYDAHFVGIYYALAPHPHPEPAGTGGYYALPAGTIVLCSHIPDGGDFDRRGPHTRSYFEVAAKAGRLIVHPGTLGHFVTPSAGEERLAVTCNYVLARDYGYASYRAASL